MLALAGVAKAQLLTYETVQPWEGSAISFSGSGSGATRGQLFTSVSAVKSLTFLFFTNSTAATTSLQAAFGEWNTATNTFVAGSSVSFGTIVIPPSSSWAELNTLLDGIDPDLNNAYADGNPTNAYAHTFDLSAITSTLVHATYGYLTNSSKTYALMLTNVSGTNTGLALGLTNEDEFAFGYARGFTAQDWAFAQITVAPGNQQLVPIPESSTAAMAGSVMLVAFLVNSRMRQRRATAQAVVTEVAAA